MPFRIRIFMSILLALLGLLLIGPLLLPVPPLEDTAPAESLAPGDAFVNIDGVRLYHQDLGSGEPSFLLLHGYPSNSASWRSVLPELALFGRVVAFDRPGFGYSERPEPDSWSRGENPYLPDAQLRQALALLDRLGVDQAVWVGSSSGGIIALQAALLHPERVAALVLVAPPVESSRAPPAWLRPLLQSPQMNRLGPLLMRQLGGQPGMSLFASQWADPERIGEEDIRAFRRTFRVDDWDRGLWQVSKASREPGLAEGLERVAVPALVVAGSEDQIVPAKESERLARQLPESTLALMEGCGHLPHEECPAAFAELLSDWLEGTAITGGR